MGCYIVSYRAFNKIYNPLRTTGTLSTSNMSSFSQVGALNKNDRLQHEIDCFTKKLEQEKRKLVMFNEEYPKINKVLNEKRQLLSSRKKRSEKANRAAKKSSYSEEQTRYNRRSPDMKLTE